MGVPADLNVVKRPLDAIEALYASGVRPGDAEAVEAYFEAALATLEVPLLTDATADLLPHQSLVRVRGMVQDMLNPEFFVAEAPAPGGGTVACHYRDDAPAGGAGFDAARARLGERTPVVLAPVPGEAAWVAAEYGVGGAAPVAAQGGGGAAKRGRDDADDDGGARSMSVAAGGGADAEPPVDTAASRPRLGEPAAAAADAGAGAVDTDAGAGPQDEALPPGAVVAYLYGGSASLKLNDVVEVVGVLSRLPELAAAGGGVGGGAGDDSLLAAEALAAHPPPSAALRVHAVLARAAAAAPPATAAAAAAAPPGSPAFAAGRAAAAAWLAAALGGDVLAAEYLLLQAAARVRARGAGPEALGVPCLNLTGAPEAGGGAGGAAGGGAPAAGPAAAAEAQLSAAGAGLAAALRALCPRVAALPLTPAALNGRPWAPRRRGGGVRLAPAPLQLAAGTQLLLDETRMAAGALAASGVRSLGALQQLLTTQAVPYDFDVFSLDQPAEAPATILSAGRSLLRDAAPLALPLAAPAALAPAAAVAAAAAAPGGAAQLAAARAWLAAARAAGAAAEYAIPPPAAAAIEARLSAARARDPEGATQEAMHGWLGVARLLALSHGEAALTVERFDAAVALEGARRARLAAAERTAC